MTNDSAPLVQSPGIHPKFPKVKPFLTAYEDALSDVTGEQTRLSRLASEGPGFTYKFDPADVDRTYALGAAANDLTRLGNSERRHAVHAALSGKDDWKLRWERTVAYDYWSGLLHLERDESLAVLPKYESMKPGLWARAIFRLAVPLGDCLALGWTDWAIEGARRIYVAFDLGRFEGDYERDHFRTQYFVVRLIGDWQGWTQPEGPAYARDEPIFNELVQDWRTTDVARIETLLLAACDRHTHESRTNTNKNYYDLPSRGYWYDPFEVLAVLRLRELQGLDNPKLSHRLMETPLGQLSSPSQPYVDDLLKGIIDQIGKAHALTR